MRGSCQIWPPPARNGERKKQSLRAEIRRRGENRCCPTASAAVGHRHRRVQERHARGLIGNPFGVVAGRRSRSPSAPGRPLKTCVRRPRRWSGRGGILPSPAQASPTEFRRRHPEKRARRRELHRSPCFVPRPALLRPSNRITRAPAAAASSAEPSVEASSTTMTSSGDTVWAKAVRTVAATVPWAFRHGMMIETAQGRCSPDPGGMDSSRIFYSKVCVPQFYALRCRSRASAGIQALAAQRAQAVWRLHRGRIEIAAMHLSSTQIPAADGVARCWLPKHCCAGANLTLSVPENASAWERRRPGVFRLTVFENRRRQPLISLDRPDQRNNRMKRSTWFGILIGILRPSSAPQRERRRPPALPRSSLSRWFRTRHRSRPKSLCVIPAQLR